MGPALISGAIGMAQNAYNNQLSERAVEKQYQRQLSFWHNQNRYNSPLNQRLRFQQAGMNPIENVQSQPAGELSSVPENKSMQRGIDFVNIFSQLSQAEKMGAETDLLSQQLVIAYIEEALKEGMLFGQKIDNETKRILLKYTDAKQRLELDKLDSEIAFNFARTRESDASAESITQKLPYEKDSLKASAEHHRSVTALNNELAETERQMRDVRNELAMAQTDDLRSQILTRAQQISINFAQLEVNRHLMKSQVKLNSANTDVARRELYESARTFDTRKLAMIISNSMGMAEAEATAYATEVKKAWDDVISGLSSWSPEEIGKALDALPTAFGGFLGGIDMSLFFPVKGKK